MSVAEAMEAGFLSALDEDEANICLQVKFCLYLHAHDHSLLTQDILGYPSFDNTEYQICTLPYI